MLIREENLVILDAKNKVRLISIRLSNNPIDNTYQINRTTGQFGGKTIYRPTITIASGKIKKTIGEQASYQYNNIIQNYLDKGYVKLSSLTKARLDVLTEGVIKSLLCGNVIPEHYTLPRPMLAKSSDRCSADIWDKQLAISAKISGVRMLMYYQNGVIKTASRGSKNYNVATEHLREDPIIKALFKTNPKLILDGELYIHSFNWSEERLTQVARVSERIPECDELEYWIYDYVDTKPFRERLTILKAMKELFPENSKIKFMDHYILSGYNNIKKTHDTFVNNGFDGLCARTLDKEYGINKRSALYLIKFENYKKSEFKITKIEKDESSENLKFTLADYEEREFTVKPTNVTDLNEILNNKEKYIGKKIYCGYSYLSKDKIPIYPILSHINFVE